VSFVLIEVWRSIELFFVERKVIFLKLFFKCFYIYLLLKKLINKKCFSVKEKFSLVSKKVFSFYFEWKTLSRSCEKFRNIILFADYNKFGPQTYNYYIFCFESFFLISPLKIWFNLIFILTLVLIFMIIICFSLIIFLIEIFYLSNLVLILWLLLILFEIIYEIVIIIILISSSFNFFYI
jgi:hypothetical protein